MPSGSGSGSIKLLFSQQPLVIIVLLLTTTLFSLFVKSSFSFSSSSFGYCSRTIIILSLKPPSTTTYCSRKSSFNSHIGFSFLLSKQRRLLLLSSSSRIESQQQVLSTRRKYPFFHNLHRFSSSSRLSSFPYYSTSKIYYSNNKMDTISTNNNNNNNNNVIDGKSIANQILLELTHQVTHLTMKYNLIPGLAVILIGSRKDSQTYVKMKKKACTQVGIASFGYEYPDTVTQDEILDLIVQLNQDSKVHGILIQLPLPKHLDETLLLETVDPNKDVDGLHPKNTALLSSMNTHQRYQQQNQQVQQGSSSSMTTFMMLDWKDLSSIPFHIPCTPQGCIELLDRCHVDIKGKHAVVVGRSNLVGMPVAMLLLHRDATVTIVHSKTIDASKIVQQADIVVAAVGRAEMIQKEWIRPGAIVIDVGINSIEDTKDPRGYRLVGDVDYNQVKDIASLITPVPGGVGPMTIAMLLRNTVNSCLRFAGYNSNTGKEE